jgi:hypothetical protein
VYTGETCANNINEGVENLCGNIWRVGSGCHWRQGTFGSVFAMVRDLCLFRNTCHVHMKEAMIGDLEVINSSSVRFMNN